MSKTQGKYGADHQKQRKQAIGLLTDGTLCHYCRKPMFHWQRLDLDHIVPLAVGGKNGPTVLTHSHCNRSAGARLKNRMYPNRKGIKKRKRKLW